MRKQEPESTAMATPDFLEKRVHFILRKCFIQWRDIAKYLSIYISPSKPSSSRMYVTNYVTGGSHVICKIS